MIGQVLVAAGFLLMVYNVIRAFMFVRTVGDVLVGRRATATSIAVLVFLAFFAIVYAIIFIQNFNEISIGVILLSGSMFVTFVLMWIIRLVDTVKGATTGMAEALSTAIEARDPTLKGHGQHVRRLSLELYDELSDHARRSLNRSNLEFAALFHDLGKLGIPEAILNKPDKLTSEEWDIVVNHPKIGVQILQPVASFDDISDWILYHHERVDGSGYYGLKGDQIPLGARIIAVADAFSAMFLRRPYQDAVNYEECVAELKKSAGTHLDPELVDAFCRIPRETVLACSNDLAQ